MGGDLGAGRGPLRRRSGRFARARRCLLRYAGARRRGDGHVCRRPQQRLDRRGGRSAQLHRGRRAAPGHHALRNRTPGLLLCGRFGCGLLCHAAGGRAGRQAGPRRRAHFGRHLRPDGHCGRYGAPRGLRRQSQRRSLPHCPVAPGAADAAGPASEPHPRPGGRLARHPVGHDAPRRHHALQPLNGRLQALRAEALYGLLQPRYDHEDRRGRRPPVDQDEPVRVRLLRPQAGPRAALLQRSRAAELSDDQRRRALRRAGRRAVALDLQRARPAQGGAAAAASRPTSSRSTPIRRIRFRARSAH